MARRGIPGSGYLIYDRSFTLPVKGIYHLERIRLNGHEGIKTFETGLQVGCPEVAPVRYPDHQVGVLSRIEKIIIPVGN
jgi:hypothetical protein